jgi:medium-chain acyl-[acyl-carrier-protein] hydrolase
MDDPHATNARLREQFRVRSYEADSLGRLQVPILCRMLQEAATAHAAELGVAVDALVDNGVAWVLSRLDLHVERWPRCDERRRPVRRPAQVADQLSKLELSPDPVRPQELVPPEDATSELAFTVRRSDVDLAGHANNTSFVEWIVEAVPDEVWTSCDLSELSIQFIAECRRGQTVLSRSQLVSDADTREVRHQLTRVEDGVEVARARTSWQRHPLER